MQGLKLKFNEENLDCVRKKTINSDPYETRSLLINCNGLKKRNRSEEFSRRICVSDVCEDRFMEDILR